MGRPRLSEVKFCKECGKEIDIHNKSFCSRACRNRHFSKHPTEVEKTCVICGKVFMAQRHNRKYCSDQCNWKAQAARRRKRDKPGYKDPQGKIWKEKRWTIYDKQNGQCWLCNKKLEEVGDRFQLHHMEYGDHSVESETLVVLCTSCHNRIHHVTVTLTKENKLEFHGIALELLEKKTKEGE